MVDHPRPRATTNSPVAAESSATALASGDYWGNSQCNEPRPLAIEAPPTAGGSSSIGCYNAGPSNHESGYVGLVNQAMTCYLNSLLQSLFMTPEFRNALYTWEYDGSGVPTKSIPFQLQKLFLKMQTSERAAVKTTALTRSFGWNSSEAWQQHDVQELCRVMFDALESQFRNTQQSDLISRLYEGTMIDYVRCLECGTERDREDTYLDIPLPIRPFGVTEAYDSVESALRGFVTPERLDGNNQYFCEHCKKKCDALKGLKFKTFPYLLTLHLKRFDFDYRTLRRVKLNDRVSFPQVLDISSLLDDSGLEVARDISPQQQHQQSDNCRFDDTSTTDSGAVLDDELPQGGATAGPAASSSSDCTAPQDDEGFDCWTEETAERLSEVSAGSSSTSTGCQYQLFSVMVHSGCANGGHYYAYIRDSVTTKWHSFNDQSVSPITQGDIERTFGDSPSRFGFSGVYMSSATAYMLMYRRIDRYRNATPMTTDQFPSWIQKLLEETRESEEQEVVTTERERTLCQTRLFYRSSTVDVLSCQPFAIQGNLALPEVTKLALNRCGLEDTLPLDQCRLVRYDDRSSTILESLEWLGEQGVSMALRQSWTDSRSPCLLLQTRLPHQKFRVHRLTDISVPLVFVDTVRERLLKPGDTAVDRCDQLFSRLHRLDKLQLSWSCDVAALRQQLCEDVNGVVAGGSSDGEVPVFSRGRMCLVKADRSLCHLDDDKCSLVNLGIGDKCRLYVGLDDENDEQLPLSSSLFRKLCELHVHAVTVQALIPSVNADLLRLLGIPPVWSEFMQADGDCVESVFSGSPLSSLSMAPTVAPSVVSSSDSNVDSESTLIGSASLDTTGTDVQLGSIADVQLGSSADVQLGSSEAQLSCSADADIQLGSSADADVQLGYSEAQLGSSADADVQLGSSDIQLGSSEAQLGFSVGADVQLGSSTDADVQLGSSADVVVQLGSSEVQLDSSAGTDVQLGYGADADIQLGSSGVQLGSSGVQLGDIADTDVQLGSSAGETSGEASCSSNCAAASSSVGLQSTPTNSPANSDYQSALVAHDWERDQWDGFDDLVVNMGDSDVSGRTTPPGGNCHQPADSHDREWRVPFTVVDRGGVGSETAGNSEWKLKLDDRITVETFLSEIGNQIGVDSSFLQLFKVYSNGTEIQCYGGRVLTAVSDGHVDFSLRVKLHRQARDGEIRVRLYRLGLSSSEYMFDWIVHLDNTVAETKENILAYYSALTSTEPVPIERCRLRWKHALLLGKVLLNHDKQEPDVQLIDSQEMFVQILPTPDHYLSHSQLLIVTRRFYPHQSWLSPALELLLPERTGPALLHVLSVSCGVAADCLRVCGRALAVGDMTSQSHALLRRLADTEWLTCQQFADQESSPLLETGSSIADLLLIYKDSSELLGDHEPPTAPGGPSVSSWAHPDATGPSEAPYSVTPAPRQFRESALRIRTTSSPSPPPDYQAF